ncbi:hypothetical protein [Streptomyces gibsoniae]|uniref:Uncharacterized protein n=1 Tax=Streptomyces gibsoniae TaxID=3075529 RepID=A0ABU2TTS2_9ACTN|nr:hypothetical protein [Streptomyces sp. DSM 41699]MDT0464363.1 hypothetical protein [Streptomyces sp. DSM 41699]
MPVHMSTFQLLGVPALALVTAVWIVYVGRALRRRDDEEAARWRVRAEDAARYHHEVLRGLPRQPQSGPELESVELTPAEQDAFAGLMRQLRDGRS